MVTFGEWAEGKGFGVGVKGKGRILSMGLLVTFFIHFTQYMRQRVARSSMERGIYGLERPRGGYKVTGPMECLTKGS